MTDSELQEEEREVLESIYEGDECFKQVSPDIFQYKVRLSGLFPYGLILRFFLLVWRK